MVISSLNIRHHLALRSSSSSSSSSSSNNLAGFFLATTQQLVATTACALLLHRELCSTTTHTLVAAFSLHLTYKCVAQEGDDYCVARVMSDEREATTEPEATTYNTRVVVLIITNTNKSG
jgi:hypothetical protein